MALRIATCEGYKAFSAATSLELGSINVFFGKNNSGKTTLARLPIFLLESLSAENFYALAAGDLSFGTSFQDLASPEQSHPRISIGLQWDNGKLGATLQQVSTPDGRHQVAVVRLESNNSSWDFDLSEFSLQGGDARNLPTADELSAVRGLQSNLANMSSRVARIESARPRIEHVYSVRDPLSWTAAEVPYILESDRDLMGAVADWMSEALQVHDVSTESAAFAFRLTAGERLATVNLASAGRGTQAVLPVVTLLQAVAHERFACDLLIVEEPEAHLHPSAHGSIADLIIQAAGRTQVVVETHSETFILRLRRRIAQNSLSPDDLRLYYVDENHAVSRISMDAQGGAQNWPRGVFESDVEEAEAIMEAKLHAMQRED